ncbi:hypothetical protein [Dokdonella soli]|uniref:Uncharacterized protein n=1 Tax=Dokdonella soli TaxID=529810 RepID=A0ABP3TJ98_9GAMM
MASSNQVTQNGNTTLNWVLSGGISNHEVVVVELDNTTPNTGVQISNVRGFISPNRYSFDITVAGPDAVAFRINSTGV